MIAPKMPYVTAPSIIDCQRSIHRPFRMYREAQPTATAPIAKAAQSESEAMGLGRSWFALQTNPAANKAPVRQPNPNRTFPSRSAMARVWAPDMVNSSQENR